MYSLKLKDNKDLEFSIKVIGDVNDADFVLKETILSEEEFNETMPYLLALLKLNGVERGYKEREDIWEEFYSEDEIKVLDWYMFDYIAIPDNEWSYWAHTIESIEVTAQKDGMIYDVVIDEDKVLPIPLKRVEND